MWWVAGRFGLRAGRCRRISPAIPQGEHPYLAEDAGHTETGTGLSRMLPPAFQYPQYRAFWLGMLASVSGFQMMQFGKVVLIHDLKGFPLFLGLLGLAAGIPAIILNPLGGVYADRWDKRRLIVITQAITAGLLLLLATLTLLKMVEVWHSLTIAFLVGAVEAFDQAARRALFPHLVAWPALVSAVALNSAIWSGTRVVAPTAAGLIIARFSPAAAFYLAALGFAVMAVAVYGLNSPPRNPTAQARPLKDMLEGLGFIRRSSVFSFFGISYVYLMPIFAIDILEVGTEGQGWLLSIGEIGALLTTAWLGSRKEVKRKGLLVIGGGLAFGLSLATFGLTSRFFPSYLLALGLMLVMGVTSAAYMITITSSLQLLVPDRMRGRVMGFFGMTWNILPLGGMQVGALASLVTAPYVVAVGGLAVAAFASGSAVLSRQVRSLGSLLHQAESGVDSPATEPSASPSLPGS